MFCCVLKKPHEGCLSCFSSLTVRCSDILHCGIYRAMPERLFDKREIDVASHQMGSQTVLQRMRVPFPSRQAGDTGISLKQSKELRSVESPALLARKQIIRAVSRSLSQPRSQCRNLIQERQSPMRIKRLRRFQRTLESL